jgi:puromycin-sensitive aminopeptidase
VHRGEATGTVVMNAADLEIGEARVDGEAATVRLDDAQERLVLDLASPLEAGTTTVVELSFTGVLNDRLKGFYRSTYTAADGTTKTIATTQMQSTDCRRAFPCFDEPDFKAVFGVTLVVADGLVAISNGPEVERTPQADGTVAVRFADTMKMSTYLVAFVVGELEMTDAVDVGGIPLRVVHVPGKGDLTAFALDCGAFCLQWFQDYYGIPYPGEKVDLVAIPDFAFGAMENLGCITFREVLLLVDPANATQQEEQVVADVIAHELAHMWFGDLVTMGWWNGIWLNEAFATFMEIKACDAYEPEWDRWTSFGLERTAAFDVDALRSTRPIEFEVLSPADAEGMFDVLTYQKGGAVLRMLEQHLGEDRFRDGIRMYLRRHQYANTETADLWDALEESTGEPVRRMMDGWIWQGGHPLVSAGVQDGQVVLHQRRFLADGGTDDATVWDVPVRLPDGQRVLLGQARCVRPTRAGRTSSIPARRASSGPRTTTSSAAASEGPSSRRSRRWSATSWWTTPGRPWSQAISPPRRTASSSVASPTTRSSRSGRSCSQDWLGATASSTAPPGRGSAPSCAGSSARHSTAWVPRRSPGNAPSRQNCVARCCGAWPCSVTIRRRRHGPASSSSRPWWAASRPTPRW